MQRVSPVRILLTTTVLAAGFLFVATSSALAQGSKPLPALTQTSPDALTRALAAGELTQAQYALQRALSLFRPAQVAARYGEVKRPDPRVATLILRDLAIRVRYLSGADRRQALAILARPTDSTPGDPDRYSTPEQTPLCGTNVCIHYVTTTGDAVPATDTTPNNGIPDYVEQTLAVFNNDVWGEEVTTMGYRAPKSDVTSDNNGSSSQDLTGVKFDVYLANLGDDQLYGYCTSDDPHFDHGSHYQFFDGSAYCVVDNNYTEVIFQNHSPLENLQVTAAHRVLPCRSVRLQRIRGPVVLEATATWMEDEIYTDINDNLQYLVDGPLHKPLVPLDKGATNADPCCHVYGDWIFFRYLSETFDSDIVRKIWNRADASEDTDLGGPDGEGPDDFSVQAVSRVLSSRGGFRSRFANSAG